tara:strand:+ start:5931 stop:6470 length:540 start_codon:yes stop_codon:yes gene_type:complete
MRNLYYLLLSAFLLFSTLTSFAQAPTHYPLVPIFQLDTFLQESYNGPLATSAVYLKKIAYDLVPSIYLNRGELKVDDESPIRLVTDVISIEKLYELNSLYDNVQIIIIQINDENELTRFLKGNSLNHFSHLKYIYISCSFKLCDDSVGKNLCEKNKILSILNGELSPITALVYTVNQSE